MSSETVLSQVLRRKLDSLKLRYPSYSMRALARKAQISPSSLSLILNGKRNLASKSLEKICQRLELDPIEKAQILGPFKVKQSISPATLLSMDQYQIISDWKAFAILNLINTKNFQSNESWIAKRLGISLKDAKETLMQLQRTGMLKKTKEKKYVRTYPKWTTTEDVSNLAIKHSHEQSLNLASAALEKLPVKQRDFSSVTFAMDKKQLSEAKVLIRRFQDDFMSILENKGEPDSVYRLSMQLFPLSSESEANGKEF